MTEPRSLTVLIAGAGLAGLALAQGLLKSGHEVQIFERDADLNRKQGYYLHFNQLGGDALQRCLPDDLYELYLDTARRTYERHESIVLTPGLDEITSQPHLIPHVPGPREHTGVHRRTLRQILLARLGDRLHTGNPVTSFEQDADGVTVHLADGTTARGDVLVGADGIRSAVRSELLPDVPVIPTGIQGIGVFGRTPITPELDALLPDLLNQGVLIAADRTGTRLLIAVFRPRKAAQEAAAERGVVLEIDDVPPYVMVSCSVEKGFDVPGAREWTEVTAKSVQDSQLKAIDGWHPAARALVEGQDLDSMFMVPFGFLEPAEDWTPSRVTIIGDAAHGMLPTLGMGANLALNDSAVLTEQLDRVGRGEVEIPEAIGTYEAQMRELSYPLIRRTLQHDQNFGGGGLQKDAGTGAVGL